MNVLIYSGVILAGAATLVIDAYKNYEQSLQSIPFKDHIILEDVNVSKLCTRRERNIGFVFYSMLYLLTYAVVLSSAELYELLQNVAKTNAQVGPPNELIGINNDPLSLVDTQYGKPIFVSAAIIALFSLGAFKPIETTMRSLAHRLAGVPRGVYAVIEELRCEDFTTYKTNDPTPLLNRFRKFVLPAFRDSNDEDQIPQIEKALIGIDFLAPTVTGQSRVHYFPMIQLASLDDLSSKLTQQITALRAALEDAPTDNEKRAALTRQIMRDYNDTVAVLAVHFLRNNRAIKDTEIRKPAPSPAPVEGEATPAKAKRWNILSGSSKRAKKRKPQTAIDIVRERIKRGYRAEHNSFGMAILLSFILGMGCCYAIYMHWNEKRAPITEGRVAYSMLESERFLKIFNNDADARSECAKAVPLPSRISFGKVQEIQPTVSAKKTVIKATDEIRRLKAWSPELETCQYAWTVVFNEENNQRRKDLLTVSFWVVVPVLLSISFAALTAIFGREVRHEDASWSTNWSLRRIPFMRLFYMSVIPSLVAVLGLVVGLMAQLLIETGFEVTQQVLVSNIRTKLPFMAMHLGVGFIISMAVLTLIDQHERLYNEQTIFLALIFALVIMAWYFLVIYVSYPPDFTDITPLGLIVNIAYQTREALLHGAAPALFIVLFGIFLEITEEAESDKGWLVLAPFVWSLGLRKEKQ